jgi:hypothetical protein
MTFSAPSRSSAYEVDDIIDVTPPAAPTVVGGEVGHYDDQDDSCNGDSGGCGQYTYLSVDVVAPEDDHSPPDRLTYAIYVGYTAEQARDAEEISHLAYASPDLWATTLLPLSPADVYVSVSAIDMAGNESERSDPAKIHDEPEGDDGCAVARPNARGSWLALLSVALGALVLRRGWRKPYCGGATQSWR